MGVLDEMADELGEPVELVEAFAQRWGATSPDDISDDVITGIRWDLDRFGCRSVPELWCPNEGTGRGATKMTFDHRRS